MASEFDYATIAPGYYDHVFNRRRGVQSKWHHLKLAAVRKAVTAFPLLDVGCGPGTFLGQVDGGQMVGVDISPAQITYARTRYGHPDRHYLAANAAHLPFADGSFATVTMVELVEHLSPSQMQQLLAEATRVLRPGGTLILTTPNYGGPWPLLEWCVNRLGPVDYSDQHITHFTRDRLVSALAGAGLVDARVDGLLFLGWGLALFNWALADHVTALEHQLIPAKWRMLLLAQARKPL